MNSELLYTIDTFYYGLLVLIYSAIILFIIGLIVFLIVKDKKRKKKEEKNVLCYVIIGFLVAGILALGYPLYSAAALYRRITKKEECITEKGAFSFIDVEENEYRASVTGYTIEFEIEGKRFKPENGFNIEDVKKLYGAKYVEAEYIIFKDKIYIINILSAEDSFSETNSIISEGKQINERYI